MYNELIDIDKEGNVIIQDNSITTRFNSHN